MGRDWQRSDQPSKADIRHQARIRRQNVSDREDRSRQVMARLMGLPQFERAEQVLFYVSARTEVWTMEALEQLLDGGKPVCVPYCSGDELALFPLRDLDELAEGRFGILEPAEFLRTSADRSCSLDQIDLIVVPGLAFDRRGGRIGYGQGFYDRLLQRAAPHTLFVAAAFECQLFDQIPMAAHDIRMHCVVTEQAVYS